MDLAREESTRKGIHRTGRGGGGHNTITSGKQRGAEKGGGDISERKYAANRLGEITGNDEGLMAMQLAGFRGAESVLKTKAERVG